MLPLSPCGGAAPALLLPRLLLTCGCLVEAPRRGLSGGQGRQCTWATVCTGPWRPAGSPARGCNRPFPAMQRLRFLQS